MLCACSLQEKRIEVLELQALLEAERVSQTNPEKRGNSIFSEVEDRRQQVERQLAKLTTLLDREKKKSIDLQAEIVKVRVGGIGRCHLALPFLRLPHYLIELILAISFPADSYSHLLALEPVGLRCLRWNRTRSKQACRTTGKPFAEHQRPESGDVAINLSFYLSLCRSQRSPTHSGSDCPEIFHVTIRMFI